jgi:hypothetical protein
MTRIIPNIEVGTTLKKRDILGFKDFVLEVIVDTFLYEFQPTELEVINNTIFVLYLRNKRFIIDALQVDDVKEYIDIYLYGVRQPQDRYNVEVFDNNIIVTFTADITRLPNDVTAANFEIKGKIAEIE